MHTTQRRFLLKNVTAFTKTHYRINKLRISLLKPHYLDIPQSITHTLVTLQFIPVTQDPSQRNTWHETHLLALHPPHYTTHATSPIQ